jgi:hypothetical protein
MTKDQVTKALDQAFDAHVVSLFGYLCVAITDAGANEAEIERVRGRFERGFHIAEVARDEMVARLIGGV